MPDDLIANAPSLAGKKSYIMASYVTFLQAAGARIVPILVTETEEETFAKMANLNGVLLPGGEGGYEDKAR